MCEGLYAAFLVLSPHNSHLASFWLLCSDGGWVDVVSMWDFWVHLEKEYSENSWVNCSVPLACLINW